MGSPDAYFLVFRELRIPLIVSACKWRETRGLSAYQINCYLPPIHLKIGIQMTNRLLSFPVRLLEQSRTL